MTQPTLREKVGGSIENIKRIERFDVVEVGIELVPKLAEALGVAPEDLEAPEGSGSEPAEASVANADAIDLAMIIKLAEQLDADSRSEVVRRLGGKPMKHAAKKMRNEK